MKSSLLRKLLLSLLVTVLFFVLLEAVLAVAGVKAKPYPDDPYLGFSSHSPLFRLVEDTDGRRVYRVADNKLRLFNPQEFPAFKAKNTTRIFCLGGSTTFGRPFGDATSFCGWLRELLPVVDPSRNWEVINAGGVSYASYRVALLMEELLQYDPDLFVIYTGQNEFLEARSYRGIIAMPKAFRGLGALAARTRTWTVMEKILKKKETPAAQTMLPDEVETKLDASVGPSAYHRDLEEQQKIIEHFHFNLLRMFEMARAEGVAVEIVVPGANLRDCTPFKSEHSPGLDREALRRFDAAMFGAVRAARDGRLAEALNFLVAAGNIDGHYAGQLYNKGRILHGLGRNREALKAFERARDEDVCPLRILGSMVEIVRESGREGKVPSVDFNAFLRQRAEDGIPGKEFFLDHVHPTIETHLLLARLILDDLIRRGVVHPSSSWGDEQLKTVHDRVMATIDDEKRGLALSRLSKVVGWAGKIREAYDLSRRAIRLAPDSSSVWYQAGLTAQLLGRKEEAETAYRRCLEIQPDADLPRQNLGVLLQKKGDLQGAAEEFREAIRLARDQKTVEANRQNLSDALMAQGNRLYGKKEFEKAASKYEAAMKLRPERKDALANLGLAELAMGKHEKGIRDLEQAVQAELDNEEMHRQLAAAYVSLGRMEDAEAQMREARRLQEMAAVPPQGGKH